MRTSPDVWSILKSTPEQIWYAVAGAAFLALCALIWRIFGVRLPRKARARAARKRVDELATRQSSLKILEHGPGISIDDRTVREISDVFRLAMPMDLVEDLLIRPDFQETVNDTYSIFGTDRLAALGDILKIDGIEEKIAPHYRQTVEDFRAETKGIRFNSRLYGVRQFRRGRLGAEETPYVSLCVYETDYFTFRVMDAFHREIAEKEPERSLIGLKEDNDINDRLYPFLVSIGLNFVLLCPDDRIILTRRSRNVDTFGLPAESIYPSFNEAVSQTDLIIPADRKTVPSIPSCFDRGLSEELGLQAVEVNAPSYRLVGVGMNGVGLGIYGYAETKLPSTEIVTRMSGRDRGFESAAVFAVPIKKEGFRKLIRSADTSPQVRLLLAAVGVDRGFTDLY